MKQFFGITLHEFKMSIRRKGLWIAYSIVFFFFSTAIFAPNHSGPSEIFGVNSPWIEAGETVYMFNMLMPLIGGILSADRMQRDFRLDLRELQRSTPIKTGSYILSKYFGVLLSTLMPMFIWVLIISIYAALSGQTTPSIISSTVVAFLAITVPSFAFVVAFSLALPLVIPIRVYQILFTGYWFWGNYLNDEVFPTISGTILNSSGRYALQGFFRGTISRTSDAPHTATEAWLNILVLLLCAACVLIVLNYYIAAKNRKA